MGFLDFAGEMVGKFGALAQEVNALKSDYESMTNEELKREYESLKGKSGREQRNRLMAVGSVLSDRGIVVKPNNN